MKSSRFRIVSALFTAVSLVALYFAAEAWHVESTGALAREQVSAASAALLRDANRDPLLSLADTPSTFAMPDLAFLSRFQDLVAVDTPSGDVYVPPLFSTTPGRASLSMRAHFTHGTADIHAEMAYREGQWRLLRYELVPGPGVM